MFFLVLRRYRAQIVVLGLLTLALTAVFLIHGAQAGEANPRSLPDPLESRYWELSQLMTYLHAGPAVIGAFWGAPLVSRELELQTMRFVWAQAVSRRQWFGWYIGVLSLILGILSAVLGHAIVWWLGRFQGVGLPGVADDPGLLPLRGLSLTGWWLLAFAIGTLAGAALRRTLAAMGATVAVLLVVTFLVQNIQFTILTGGAGWNLHPTTATLVVFGMFCAAALAVFLSSWLIVRRAPV